MSMKWTFKALTCEMPPGGGGEEVTLKCQRAHSTYQLFSFLLKFNAPFMIGVALMSNLML